MVDEVAGAARLVGALVDQLTIPVRDTHRAVADRVFRALGPVATPVRLAHDSIAGAVYASVRGGARSIGGAAGAALAATSGGRERRPVSAHPLGAQATAFLSGLLGEWLDGRADDLRVRVAVSHHGRVVPLGDPVIAGLPGQEVQLAQRLDIVSDRMVVFVHGLAETSGAWRWWMTDDEGRSIPSYPERLQAVGWTPLEVTYDTGPAVSVSGRVLADTIAILVDRWPVPVAEIALVGHSMGGLVVGAACHEAVSTHSEWPDLVSHVVTLGAPHRGSWLAQLAANGSRTLGLIPESRGLAGILDLRSAGIRDLTIGWRPDLPEVESSGSDAAAQLADLAALLPLAQHAFVGSTLRAPGHPVSRLFGDGLVHLHSATGPADGGHPNVRVRRHVGVGHIRLVHHPDVADDLVEWLTPRFRGIDPSS